MNCWALRLSTTMPRGAFAGGDLVDGLTVCCRCGVRRWGRKRRGSQQRGLAAGEAEGMSREAHGGAVASIGRQGKARH